MLVTRGLRLRMQPCKSTCTGGSKKVARVPRTLLVLLAMAQSALCCAWQAVSMDPADVHALDGIYLGNTPSYQEGMTPAGIRYKITRNEGEQLYSGHYIGQTTGHDRVRIEFDPPIAAVGAECLTSGYRTLLTVPESQLSPSPTLYFSESGYLALVGTEERISEVTLVTDSGPLIINRIDIRPFPTANPESLSCPKDGGIEMGAGTVLANDDFAEEAILVSSPLHARRFEFRPDGSFLYVPVEGYTGLDSFEYRAANGEGATLTPTVVTSLCIQDRNCPPTFHGQGDLECRAGDGALVFNGWAAGMDPGSSDEARQETWWDIHSDRPDLFLVQPRLDRDGNLTFEPDPNHFGEAVVTVKLLDDGGTANGGSDASIPEVFTISIAPAERAPLLSGIPDMIVDPDEGLHLCVAPPNSAMLEPTTYELESAPSGAMIDAQTGTLGWIPSPSAAPGIYEFSVRAAEGGPLGLTSTVRFRAEILDKDSRIARSHMNWRYAKLLVLLATVVIGG